MGTPLGGFTVIVARDHVRQCNNRYNERRHSDNFARRPNAGEKIVRTSDLGLDRSLLNVNTAVSITLKEQL